MHQLSLNKTCANFKLIFHFSEYFPCVIDVFKNEFCVNKLLTYAIWISPFTAPYERVNMQLIRNVAHLSPLQPRPILVILRVHVKSDK
jgi:hypothetical protein